MLLKKQTVWLLTMLSLVIVLSVYYITSPTQQVNDMASQEEGKKQTENQQEDNKQTSANGEMEVVTEAAGDEAFDAMRIEMQNQRDALHEELTAKVGNADLSADEKSAAYEQMEVLRELATTESVLETMIKTMGYEDALVRADGDKVNITVKADEHSATAANEIIRLVTSEIGQLKPVAVQFQASN
ncbi:SpoIIIAH-like family protein [Bacillus seohaeanensis]|jgi:stage III sporulation protein AH|uniref:SpoIIIAH-like family protein n=1 Tax=Bacillus seohaeanensis TaxID=284580 RepID=A0ABW5RS77_9BACI